MNPQTGGKFVGEGSYGNVFYPGFPCKDKDTKQDYDLVKIFTTKQGKQLAIQEITNGNKIKQIPNYKDWAWIWNVSCKPKNYHSMLRSDSDISKLRLYSSIQDINRYSYMLKGYHGGKPLNELVQDIFTKDIFQKKQLFINAFYNYMDLCNSLFLGLKELFKAGMSHNDIKINNVVVWIRPRGDKIKEFRDRQYAPGRWNRCGVDGLKLIDFGISCNHNDASHFQDRSVLEFITRRITLNYTYQYIYAYVSKSLLQDELDETIQGYYREFHGIFKDIHEDLFQRKNIDAYVIQELKQTIQNPLTSSEKREMSQLIDIYSLGITLLLPLYTTALYLDCDSKLKTYLRSKQLKPFLDVFKQMTTLSYKQRIHPEKAFRLHTQLISG